MKTLPCDVHLIQRVVRNMVDNAIKEDKLQIIEEIWTDLAETPEKIPSPSWHADVLCAREKRISEGTSHFLDLAEAKKAVREQQRLRDYCF